MDVRDQSGSHGTLDHQLSFKPIEDARRLRVQKNDDPAQKLPEPKYNAESYAGAATGEVDIFLLQ